MLCPALNQLQKIIAEGRCIVLRTDARYFIAVEYFRASGYRKPRLVQEFGEQGRATAICKADEEEVYLTQSRFLLSTEVAQRLIAKMGLYLPLGVVRGPDNVPDADCEEYLAA